MKKFLIVILVIFCGAAGYLYYDWQVKTRQQAAEPSITLYSWTDARGTKHFSDTPPPTEAKNIQKTKGHKYVAPPLVETLQDQPLKIYRWLKKKVTGIFKSKSEK